MATKVFISWSGDLSRKLAEVLRGWLPGVLQFVRPYFTPEDVEKGTKWDTEIAKELESSNIGIICLTRDNIDKPWILFEAGALCKRFDRSKVCPLLFNLEPTDLKGPLSSFQCAKFAREQFKGLVGSINNEAGEAKLEQDVLNSVFDMWWPKIDERVTHILSTSSDKKEKGLRSDKDILIEILGLARIAAQGTVRPQRYLDYRPQDLLHGLHDLVGCIDPMRADAARDALRTMLLPLQRIFRMATDTESGRESLWKLRRLIQSFDKEVPIPNEDIEIDFSDEKKSA